MIEKYGKISFGRDFLEHDRLIANSLDNNIANCTSVQTEDSTWRSPRYNFALLY